MLSTPWIFANWFAGGLTVTGARDSSRASRSGGATKIAVSLIGDGFGVPEAAVSAGLVPRDGDLIRFALLVGCEIDGRNDRLAFQRQGHARRRLEADAIAGHHQAADARRHRLRQHDRVRGSAADRIHAVLEREEAGQRRVVAPVVGFVLHTELLDLFHDGRIGGRERHRDRENGACNHVPSIVHDRIQST